MLGERNRYLDVLKGVAILIVVFGHSLQSANGMVPNLPVQQIIMTFWMPLFFLVAGYTDGMTNGGSGLGSKILRLLVPYLIWSQVVFAYDLYCGQPYTVVGHLNSTVNSGFWFLRMLFMCWFSCYVYRKVSWLLKDCWQCVKVLGSGATMVMVAFLLGGETIAHYLPLYLLGIAVFRVLVDIKLRFRRYIMIGGAAVFVIEAVAMLNVQNALIARILDLSMSITGSLSVCLVVMVLERVKWCSPFLAYCGRQSLGVYAVHWCLLFYMNPLRMHSLVVRGVNVYLVALIGFVGWTLICLFLIMLFGRIDALNRYLLGNKGRRRGE